ncbi:hypothetical protein [Nocardioides sp. W7]|uniref:hypothetical protein n=1 Tax=Nocardioides sp. W7 TaxID=2931390 RepID=UPI001FD2C46F|nr:hypothetical protein [Nocardioides sp. W7]
MSEHPTGRLSSGRHPVNVGHLVMGIAFLGLVAVWAVVHSDAVADEHIRWLLPVPWVLAGGAGLLASVLAGHRHQQPQVGWIQPSDAAEPEPRRDEDEPLG